MAIKFVDGDILSCDCAAITITVNCVGIMGKGLALNAKEKFPEIYPIYKSSCDNGELILGGVPLWISTNRLINGISQSVVCFPTKYHWRNNSDYKSIIKSITHLKRDLISLNTPSIAIPPLGCGNGNLNWSIIHDIIYEHFSDIKTEVFIYGPDLTGWRY